MPAASAVRRHVTPAGSAAGRSGALYSALFIFKCLAESRRSTALHGSMGDDNTVDARHAETAYPDGGRLGVRPICPAAIVVADGANGGLARRAPSGKAAVTPAQRSAASPIPPGSCPLPVC